MNTYFGTISNIKKNEYLSYLLLFLSSLSFTLPIWTYFFTDYAGFTLAQATFLGYAGGIMPLLFEVHSGVWADTFGRKKMLIVGVFLKIVGVTFFLFGGSFVWYLIGVLIGGMGSAVSSGCILSLIYDLYQEAGKKELFSTFTRRIQYATFSGRAIAAGFAGYMFVHSPLLPYGGVFVALLICLVCCFFLDESRIPHFSKTDRAHIVKARSLLRMNKKLFFHFFVTLSLLSLVNLIWVLYQTIFKEIGLHVGDVSLLYIVISLLSLLGVWGTKKIYTHGKTSFSIFIQASGIIVLALSLLFLPGLRKLVGFVWLQITLGTYSPVLNNEINHAVGSAHRSTINSIKSLFVSGGLFVMASFAGLLHEQIGTNGIAIAVLIISFVLLAVYFLKNRHYSMDK